MRKLGGRLPENQLVASKLLFAWATTRCVAGASNQIATCSRDAELYSPSYSYCYCKAARRPACVELFTPEFHRRRGRGCLRCMNLGLDIRSI
jgi:hypothetical protein